jgi:hypothetical protein
MVVFNEPKLVHTFDNIGPQTANLNAFHELIADLK